jgi:hypothetical protein
MPEFAQSNRSQSPFLKNCNHKEQGEEKKKKTAEDTEKEHRDHREFRKGI